MKNCTGLKPDAVNLWIGDSQSVTSLHKDPYENMYAVVSGSKIFTLYPPTDLPYMNYIPCKPRRYLYKPSTQGETATDDEGVWEIVKDSENESDDENSLVQWILDDPLYPTFQTPFSCDTTPLQCIVQNGELLYLPSLWFHHVQQSEFIGSEKSNHRVIAVNMWYDMDYGLNFVYYRFLEEYTKTHHSNMAVLSGDDDEVEEENDEKDMENMDENIVENNVENNVENKSENK